MMGVTLQCLLWGGQWSRSLAYLPGGNLDASCIWKGGVALLRVATS